MLKYCDEIKDEKYTLVQTDYELRDLLDMIGLPKKYRADITGAIVAIGDGDYTEVWLTESSRWYDLGAIYRSLSYYRPKSWSKSKLPVYWLD